MGDVILLACCEGIGLECVDVFCDEEEEELAPPYNLRSCGKSSDIGSSLNFFGRDSPVEVRDEESVVGGKVGGADAGGGGRMGEEDVEEEEAAEGSTSIVIGVLCGFALRGEAYASKAVETGLG